MNQIIKPLDPFGYSPTDAKAMILTVNKVNQIVERLNWLLDITPCHFVDGMCVIHDSPQVYTTNLDGCFATKVATDYCGVAEAKMRARIETNQKEE